MSFKVDAPWAMEKLIVDFDFSVEDAAAVLGNAGHESLGFKALQEIKPTVAGSKGGYGWFQWTGPRRRAFEAYCARSNLDINSREANYAFLWVELNGNEKTAVSKTKAAKGLEAKVKAFEMGFERAGVKHYPSRIEWAKKALEAYNNTSRDVVDAKAPEKAQEVSVVPEATVLPAKRPSLWVTLLILLRDALKGK